MIAGEALQHWHCQDGCASNQRKEETLMCANCRFYCLVLCCVLYASLSSLNADQLSCAPTPAVLSIFT